MKNLRIFSFSHWPARASGRLATRSSTSWPAAFSDELMFRFNPVAGTAAGFHQYDALLPSGSRAEIDAQIAALKRFEAEGAELRSARPFRRESPPTSELVLAQIQSQLLELENIRPWEKDPDAYSSGATMAIFTIMSRSFAPPAERLKSTIARERLIPRVFQSARENLKNPPRISTEIALQQLPGIVSFFQNDVPAAFRMVSDAPLVAEFQKTNRAVIDSLNAYQAFLKKTTFCRVRTAISVSAPRTTAGNCCMTRWWTPRSTGCSR